MAPSPQLSKAVQLFEAGKLDKAEKSFKKLIKNMDDAAHAQRYLGLIAHQKGRLVLAQDHFQRACKLAPSNGLFFYELGLVLRLQDKYEATCKAWEKALTLQQDPQLYHQLGTVHQQHYNNDLAIKNYQQALALQSQRIDSLCNLADILEKRNQLDEATAYIDQALNFQPSHNIASRIKATILRRQGKLDAAIDLLLALAEPEEPIAALNLHFELGQLFDKKQQSTEAYQHFKHANELLSQNHRLDAEAQQYDEQLSALTQYFTKARQTQWQTLSDNQDQSVFIVGFPRSGTTLTGQILNAHPNIQVIEEEQLVLSRLEQEIKNIPQGYPQGLDKLSQAQLAKFQSHYQDYKLQSTGGHLDPETIGIEKLPLNLVHAGLIHRLYPKAKFILVIRHPMDVCLSCFMQAFAPNAAMANFYTLENSVAFYVKVMNLWQQYVETLDLNVQLIRYEDLLENVEQSTTAVLNFLDLEWDETLRNYNQQATKQELSTPSYAQVTQPLYTSARYRWHRYREQLMPFAEQLRPFCERYGYEL